MADSNLRPISAACSRLIGAAQSKDDSDRDVKQREWIWEFVLKNDSNGRLCADLMKALPFPNENLHLKRLLLLRSLSLQLSSGLFDELTLDILRALEEATGQSVGSRAGVNCSQVPAQRVKQPRGKNFTTRTSSSEATKVAGKRGLPEILGGRKSLRSRQEEEDEEEEEIRYKIQRKKGFHSWDPTGPEDECSRKELSCLERQGPVWDLQLAVMVELTVKHLRGISVRRKAFEAALSRYWGDFITDTEEPVAKSLDFDKAREEIRNDMWKVHNNLDFLDEITSKYTQVSVTNMLASFLENTWAETQESFLKKVSQDVVNGKYVPLNPDVQRRNVGGVLRKHGVAADQRELLSEKPFVRSSRGKFSRSREKLQKTFGVFEINARRDLENEEGVAPEKLMDSGEKERSSQIVRTHEVKEILDPHWLQTRTSEESFQPASDNPHGFGKESMISRSKEVDTGVSVNEDFDHEETGRSQTCDKVRSTHEDGSDSQHEDDADKYTSGDRLAEDLRDANILPCSLNTRGTVDYSLGGLRKGKGLCQELSEKHDERAKCVDMKVANLEAPKSGSAAEEIVDLSSPSPQPLTQIQGFLSPPPWVGSSLRTRRKLASELIEMAGLVEVDAANTRATVPNGAENLAESSGPDSSERLRKENNLQSEPDVGIQVSSPEIQKTAAKFMQRNSTARTLEWEDEDDISESPPGAQGSKLDSKHRTSPSVSRGRTSSQASSQRRKPRKWTTEETELLKNEVFKYGKGRWKFILANNLTIFLGRTEVDLKDKWRNLERFEGLSIRG